MRNFKRFIFGVLVLALCFVFTNNEVSAAASCTKYKDYYYFSLITSKKVNEITSEWDIENKTYFAALPSTRQNFKHGQFCIYKNSETDCKGDKISLAKFYEQYVEALQGNKTQTITIDGKSTDTTTLRYTETTDSSSGTVTRHITHGRWTRKDDNGNVVPEDRSVPLTGYDVSLLKACTFIPYTIVTMNYGQADNTGYQNINVTIERKFNDTFTVANVMDGVDQKPIKWNGNDTPALLAPALYYDEYEVCEGSSDLYTAKIYYLYKDTNKTAATTFTRQYADGEGENVPSPTISGCVADLANVNVKINGGDFEKTVYYTCTVDRNVQTGNTLFIICMIIGFSSLAYFLYWLFIGRKKANQEV